MKSRRVLSAQHLNAEDKGEESTPVVKEATKTGGGGGEKGEEATQVSEPQQSSNVEDIEVDSLGEEGVTVKENSKAAEVGTEETPAETESEMDETSSVPTSQKRKSGEINNSGSTAKKTTVTVSNNREEQSEEDEEAESDCTSEGSFDEDLEDDFYGIETVKVFLKETKVIIICI